MRQRLLCAQVVASQLAQIAGEFGLPAGSRLAPTAQPGAHPHEDPEASGHEDGDDENDLGKEHPASLAGAFTSMLESQLVPPQGLEP